uniref:S-layer homology domain-containing protein n=1 Tax=Candidatus Scatomorpha intestinigallinarum TaxID=2840923 RepID=UPI0040261626
MKKRLVSILLVLIFLTALTPASAYDPYEPILIATVERDGRSMQFYANISNGFNRVTAMYEAFDYAKGTTATVSLENEISLAAVGDRGETVVIDDPNSNITVKPGRWNGGIVSRSPNPVFKVTAGSLTLSGLTTHAQYLIEASGDGTHVAVENCKVISGGEYDCCIQVSGGASLRVADSNISKYHTAIAVIGSPVSRTTAVIEGWTSQAILADEYAVSVTDGASVSVSGNTLLQADDSLGGCGLYVDGSSSASLSGGRYKGTYYGPGLGGAVRCEGALTIGGLLKEGFTFYDESGKAVGDDTLASQQLSGSQTYSVGQLSDDDNNPVAKVTTADGAKKQFFADDYQDGVTGALCAAWEYADNGGSASLLLVRSVTYADSSPLQLISGGSLTLNMMSGVTLTNNTNCINELIQLTSGTLRIESGNLSSAGKTAVRVVDGELEVCGGSIAVTGAANAILAHRGGLVNVTGGQISLDGCNKDGYAAVYAEAGGSVGIAGGEISLTGCTGNDCAAVYAEAGSTVGISGGEVSLSDCTGEGCAAVYAAQPGAVQLYGGVFNSSGTAFKTTGSVKDMLASNFFFYRGEEGSEKLVENEAELSAPSLGNNERFTVLMGQHGQVVASVTTDDGTMKNFTMGDGLTAEQALAEAMDYADSIGKSTLTLQRSVDITQPLRVYGNDTVLTLEMAGSSVLTMQNAADGVIQVLNGELVLDVGVIRAGGEGAVGVKMSGDSRVRVTGCEIDAGSASGSVAVSVADDAHLELTGGELLGETGVRLESSELASTLTISDLAYVNGSAYGIYAKSGSINFTGGLVNSGGCGIYLNSTSSVSLTMSSGATVVAKGSGEAVGVLLSSGAEAVIGGGASIEASSTGGRAYGVSQASGKLTVTGSASVSAASGSGQACGAFLTGGEAAISGGSFEGSSSVSGSASGLGVGANATLSLTGGSFTASGGYAVTAFAEGDDVGRLLGEGCAYFDSEGTKLDGSSVQRLGENGSVTVKSETSTGVDVAILEVGVESTTYTTDDYDTPFDALKQAFANANGKTATLTLLTSVEADELIEISNGTNLTLKMVDGAVLSGTDKVVSGSSVSVGLLSITDGSTLTFASGTINGTLQHENSRLISVAHSDFNITGGQINCECAASSQYVVYAISDLENVYKVTLSGGELNLTGEAVASADDANYGMFIEECYLDITGGRITSDDAGVFLYGSSAYIGGTAEIRATTSAIKTYNNKQLDLYGDAVIQSSGKGLDATGSSYTNVYGSVNITGSACGVCVSGGSLNVSEQPVIAGSTALRVEGGSASLSGGSYVSLGALNCVTVAEGKTVAGLLAKGYSYYTPDGTEITDTGSASLPAQMAVVKSEDAGELSGSVEITGELRFDETLSVDITGIETEDPVTLAYRWYRCNDGRGTGAALVGSGDKYTLTAADIGKYIKVTVTAENVVGILSDTTSSAVKKANGPAAPTNLNVNEDGVITGVDATMEYADNSGFAGAKTCPNDSISGLAGGTYYVRYKETATHEASAAVTVTVLSEAPIQTLTVNGNEIVVNYEYDPTKLPSGVSYDTRYNTLTVSGTAIDAEKFVLVGSTTLLFTGSDNSITNLSAVAGGTLDIQGKASLALESSDGETYEVSGELTTGGTAYRFYGSVNGGWAGIAYVGNQGAVSGSYALSGDAAVIRAGDTLTVPAGAQLTNNLTLTNNGTLIIENMNSISGSGTISGGRNVILDPGAARLTISLPQSTVYDGKTDYAEQISLVLKDKLVIQGAEFEFDASGWTMQLTRDGRAVTSAVDEGLYTVVFSRGGVSVGPACFSVTRVNLPDAMSYPVVVEPSEHGSVTASGGWAEVGSEVRLTVTPDEGWRLGSLSAVGPDGAQLALRSLGGGKYAFTMPGGKVTVSAVFVRGEGLGFTDVAPGAWYYDAVAYVSENGLMNGVDTGIFDPDGSLTRAMVWTILARIEGADTEGGETWYAKARDWAMEAGISDGTDAMGAITREQLVTMLWRSRGEPGVDFLLTARDADSISSWAYEAMRWAVSEGIIEGDENGFISPAATATRAQAAAIIMRFIEGAK